MKTNEFYRGFAVAVATVVRTCFRPEMAIEAMDCCGVTLADLIKAGADEFDLEPLRAEYKSQKRKLNGQKRKSCSRRIA